MVKFYFWSVLFLLVSPVYGQYCTSGIGPSQTIDSNVESVELVGEVGSINYTGCPGLIGLEDQTGLSTTLTAGNSYNMNVQFGTCGGNYSGAGEAWIDFNGDQMFDPSESIGTWSGTPPTSLNVFNFTVPGTVTNLPVRMRVMQHEGGSLPLDPCASFAWGSVVDFTINFTGGIDCGTYEGNTLSDAINVSTLPYSHVYNNSICYTNNNTVYPSVDVYYLLTPPPSFGAINVSLCGSSFDTFMSAFDTEGNSIIFNDDACNTQSEFMLDMSLYDSVYVIVEGWGTENGDYTLNISDLASTAEIDLKSITLYPNPTNQTFAISNAFNCDIQIYNLDGKRLKFIQNYKGETIQLDEFSTGIYFVNISNETTSINHKLVIEK